MVDKNMDGFALREILKNLYEWGIDLELWAAVPGFPLYMASTRGKIAHLKRFERPLSYNSRRPGYIRVFLYAGKQKRMRYVHGLVVLAYLDHSGQFPQVDHMDSNRFNNYLWNLRPASYGE